MFLVFHVFYSQVEIPPYSPDLSTIEMVWADLKRYVAGKRCKKIHETAKAIREF